MCLPSSLALTLRPQTSYLHLCCPQLSKEHLAHHLAQEEDKNEGLDVQDLRGKRGSGLRSASVLLCVGLSIQEPPHIPITIYSKLSSWRRLLSYLTSSPTPSQAISSFPPRSSSLPEPSTHCHAGAGLSQVHHSGVELVLEVVGMSHHCASQRQAGRHHHCGAEHGPGLETCMGKERMTCVMPIRCKPSKCPKPRVSK